MRCFPPRKCVLSPNCCVLKLAGLSAAAVRHRSANRAVTPTHTRGGAHMPPCKRTKSLTHCMWPQGVCKDSKHFLTLLLMNFGDRLARQYLSHSGPCPPWEVFDLIEQRHPLSTCSTGSVFRGGDDTALYGHRDRLLTKLCFDHRQGTCSCLRGDSEIISNAQQSSKRLLQHDREESRGALTTAKKCAGVQLSEELCQQGDSDTSHHRMTA